MERAEYFSGLWVDSDLLDFDSQAKNDAIKNRIKAILNSDNISAGSGSIVGRPGDSSLEVTQTGAGAVVVAAGQAIDKNGDFIDVPTDVTDVDDSDFEPDKPSRTVSLTSVSIDGDSDGTYYFGVKYALDSGCVKSNRDGEEFATRYYDSYEWTASTGSLASPAITLAKITTTSGGAGVVTIEDLRADQWLSCQVDARAVYIDDPPLTAMETLQDHVNMIGDASRVSTVNPHGVIVYSDFDDITNPPTGLSAATTHGVEAHDDSVPISRISSYNSSDGLQPTIDGGGLIWLDGYYSKAVDDETARVLDNTINWLYRFISVKGYVELSTTGNVKIPGGASQDSIYGRLGVINNYIIPVNYSEGYCYTYDGSSDGSTVPYIDLIDGATVSGSFETATLRIWVDSTTGALKGTMDWNANPTGYYMSYALLVSYGPRRDNTL